MLLWLTSNHPGLTARKLLRRARQTGDTALTLLRMTVGLFVAVAATPVLGHSGGAAPDLADAGHGLAAGFVHPFSGADHVLAMAAVGLWAVFVGGRLIPAGGHNILEPAIHSKPIVIGPHMQNFKEITEAFLANGAAIQVRSHRELEEAVVALMNDPVRRARLGAAARALVDANRGAKDKTLVVIHDLLPRQDRRAVVRPFRVVH